MLVTFDTGLKYFFNELLLTGGPLGKVKYYAKEWHSNLGVHLTSISLSGYLMHLL